jgi:SAM-dependent methyltransferase
MTDPTNASQLEAWNGDGGRRWVASADERDRVLAPVADALLAVAAPAPGHRVLDVGCGCGATTLMASALIEPTGSATGVDLSGPMLEVAQRRAANTGADNTTFMRADAQTHAFSPSSVDLIISRFGTMFFSDPDAAFANIATALRSEGRMCFATWQPLAANEWLAVPGSALLRHADLPSTIHGPGMFTQSDPDVVTATMRSAGFRTTAIEAVDVTFNVGQTIDEAVAYLADSGPGRALLDTIADGPPRETALDDVRRSLAGHLNSSGVLLGGGIWLVDATR